jgi:ketosteroid isomerase-like protein
MSEEQIRSAIRGFIKAGMAGDFKQVTSFLDPNAVWREPGGIHTGASEITAYMERVNKSVKGYQVVENGMGVVVQGNTGVIEHDLMGTSRGKKWQVPATCIYEFKNDKIYSIRSFYDRLSQAKQGAKGPVERTAINSIVSAMEKAIR